jgi:hypothetical protein
MWMPELWRPSVAKAAYPERVWKLYCLQGPSTLPLIRSRCPFRSVIGECTSHGPECTYLNAMITVIRAATTKFSSGDQHYDIGHDGSLRSLFAGFFSPPRER